MRNFYVDCNIEGRKTPLAGGPQRKDGGMIVHITQRDEGSISTAFEVHSYANGEDLITVVYDHDGKTVAEYRTKR